MKNVTQSDSDLFFLQFIKVFQMNFAHMETELNKDVKGAPYIQ